MSRSTRKGRTSRTDAPTTEKPETETTTETPTVAEVIEALARDEGASTTEAPTPAEVETATVSDAAPAAAEPTPATPTEKKTEPEKKPERELKAMMVGLKFFVYDAARIREIPAGR
jgi:hypothetical protein